jgi:hypothetical protein
MYSIAYISYPVVFLLLDAMTLQMGVGKVSQYEYSQAVQKWLRYAPYRVGGTALQASTTVPSVAPDTN